MFMLMFRESNWKGLHKRGLVYNTLRSVAVISTLKAKDTVQLYKLFLSGKPLTSLFPIIIPATF